jgi:hypothetical protein
MHFDLPPSFIDSECGVLSVNFFHLPLKTSLNLRVHSPSLPFSVTNLSQVDTQNPSKPLI